MAIDKSAIIEIPLVGVGYRAPFAQWILSSPEEVNCIEVTAEHFFDGGEDRLRRLAERYPIFVHGLGLSLGTAGPLDAETLDRFARVVELTDPQWISEHIAFTRTADVDLGHLNPVPCTQASLRTLVDHARQVSDRCQKPLLLENITSHLPLPGEMPETEFLNRLCESADCGLLLDVTNLFINSRNHDFDALHWLHEIASHHIRQLHVVGYSLQDGVWRDRHADPIQDEIFDLVDEVVRYAPVRAVIVERDAHFPPANVIAAELNRLENICASARFHPCARSTAE